MKTITVERLVAALIKADCGMVNFVDDEDPTDVIIDGHFDLRAVVKELNDE